ncbi:DUF4810 domain-containing protein [Aliidiomarina taiwanensis]|uniref:DUF4810 domain-containing protein n=1 Tax=Aliidiomarina taiwanensis TaxID=946228 RepID=A0A432WW58_9GAMM|nr:DUF4810 domain-containing protein [Aliidiomarina taiwanensis]RUO38002.1 DUF4810 domain-containing protein [Aliidiomarina taiwanensis]
MKRIIILACSLLLIAGCQSTPNTYYAWGNYEDALFANYHEPEAREEELTKYLNFLESTPRNNLRFGPGLFAEAGTFMLERGDVGRAIQFYELESANWPESKPLMETLITNLKARNMQAEESTHD